MTRTVNEATKEKDVAKVVSSWVNSFGGTYIEGGSGASGSGASGRGLYFVVCTLNCAPFQ